MISTWPSSARARWCRRFTGTSRAPGAAGPRMTMKSAGKMKSAAGKSILIGALAAASSASERRRRRESSARLRSVCPSESPSCSPCRSDRTNDVTSGVSIRFAMRLSARSLLSPTRSSVSTSENSSANAPSVHSTSRAIAPKRPRPASTVTASRSSASGRSLLISARRAARRWPSRSLGTTNPTMPKAPASMIVAPNDWPELAAISKRSEDAGRDQQDPVGDILLRSHPAGEAGRGEPLRQDVGELVGHEALPQPLDQPLGIRLRRVAVERPRRRRPAADDRDRGLTAPARGREGARGDEDRRRERACCEDEQEHRYHLTFPTRRRTNEPQTIMDRATSARMCPLEVFQSGLM